MAKQSQNPKAIAQPAAPDIKDSLQLIWSDPIYFAGALEATRYRRDEARRACQTPTGTQYDNIRRGLFDSGNQQPMVPVLAVAKWMTEDGGKHYDDVMLFFANDLSPLAARQMVFHAWDRNQGPKEAERNIVGYDCIVPPELDNDPMFLIGDIAPGYRGIYEGVDASVFALMYWQQSETDINRLREARWDIVLVTADHADFWEFFVSGGIAARQVKNCFSAKYFSAGLYTWARQDPIAAGLWANSCTLPASLGKPALSQARRILSTVRRIVRTPR